ncbi:Aurora kinase A and ninein-interacting protein [Bagarius yarrelli]|uniref:Aurora kinase A and ninein-interacting protein n=1 Tax=Bagarius yarrelli TaxID=175774 RepID=A0A556TPC1_BAGYA|nr:Aurora kinase A and ninein-interacting protein [Bagarius yarrelli]
MEMPATKQSRISSFFAPQSKKETEDCSSLWPSELSSTPLPGAPSGTKRKREMIFKTSELDDVSGCSSPIEKQGYNVDITSVSGEICNKDADDGDKEQQFLHLIWGYQSDECEPAEKKHCKNIQIKTVTDAQSHKVKYDAESESDQAQRQTHENFQMLKENWNGSSRALSTEDVYTQKPTKDQSVKQNRASFLTPRSDTEIQNMTNYLGKFPKDPELIKQKRRGSPVKTEDKENRRPSSEISSITRSPFNQHVQSRSAKCAMSFNRKLCHTPKKSIRDSQENDEDSLSMLFTQDSEGFRVISHRSKQPRCPLKDQTNSCEDRERSSSPFMLPLNTEESADVDPEVLFTQDSQGNIVIKH